MVDNVFVQHVANSRKVGYGLTSVLMKKVELFLVSEAGNYP
jgi:hypothetical protein